MQSERVFKVVLMHNNRPVSPNNTTDGSMPTENLVKNNALGNAFQEYIKPTDL